MFALVLLAAGIMTGETPAETPQAPDIPAVAVSDEEPAAEKKEEAPPTTRDRVFPDGWVERLYDNKQKRMESSRIPFQFGAWHWGHINNRGPLRTDYGIPGLQGTYFWYVTADPVVWKNEADGFFKSVGGHVDARFRENDRFRSFFPEPYWLWQAYGVVDTDIGRFKAGQIWKRFGLDWDGSFWGNAAYFDGLKLDPDWGVSWENNWELSEQVKLDSFAQFFFHGVGVNGSIEGAGPDSVPGSNERNYGVVRLLPTWTIEENKSVALGLSGMAGQVRNRPEVLDGRNQFNGAWAADVSYQHKNLSLFMEYLQSFGIRSPAHFVSGGPSNRIDNLLAGIHYKAGPATLRFVYSAGWYGNPGGFQELFVPGVTVAMTKNIDFYFEYVRWNLRDQRGVASPFEDGFQLVINWRY